MERQVWKSKAAREAAVKAAIAQAKTNCTKPTEPQTYTGSRTFTVAADEAIGGNGSVSVLCTPGDTYVAGSATIVATPPIAGGYASASARADGTGVDVAIFNDSSDQARVYTYVITCRRA